MEYPITLARSYDYGATQLENRQTEGMTVLGHRYPSSVTTDKTKSPHAKFPHAIADAGEPCRADLQVGRAQTGAKLGGSNVVG